MKRVQVWLINEESSRSVHEHFGQIIESHIWERKVLLGECEATSEAVAELADVEVAKAAEALARPEHPLLIGELCRGDISAALYLMVLPVALTSKTK